MTYGGPTVASLAAGQNPMGLVGFQTDFIHLDHHTQTGVSLFDQTTTLGGTTSWDAAERNGILLAAIQAGGVNNYSIKGSPFSVEYGKKLWMGARFHLDDYDATDWFFGLAPINDFQIIASAPTDMVGFICDEADGTIDAVTRASSTSTRTELTDHAMTADGQWRELAMEWDGNGRLKYYVGGKFAQLHMTNVPSTIAFTFAFEFQAAAIETASVDYVYCYKER